MSQISHHTFLFPKTRDLANTTLSTTDSFGNQIPIYTIQSNSSSHRSITITTFPTPAPSHQSKLEVAEITYHSISSKITLNLRGHAFEMRRRDPLSTGHAFTSPFTKNETWSWKEEKFLSSGLKLVDHEGKILARLAKNVGGGRGRGIEVFVKDDGKGLVEFIVVTGIAAAVYRQRSDEDLGIVDEVLGWLI